MADDPSRQDPAAQLAVAHELRNMLTIVRGYSSLLLRRLGSEGEGSSELREIDRAAARAAVLASELVEGLHPGVSPTAGPSGA